MHQKRFPEYNMESAFCLLPFHFANEFSFLALALPSRITVDIDSARLWQKSEEYNLVVRVEIIGEGPGLKKISNVLMGCQRSDRLARGGERWMRGNLQSS
jgi:hypothetical protein